MSANTQAARRINLNGDDFYGDLLLDLPYTDDPKIIEQFMADRVPSNVYFARAVPLPNGKFQAIYSAPGRLPAVSAREDGTPYVYNTEVEAEAGAAMHLHRVLNAPRIEARRSQGKSERYEKLTGPEFAMLMARAGVTATWFAYVYGTTQQRVLGWIDGVDQVPHPARLLLELIIADESNGDLIERITDSVTTSRRPERRDTR